MLQHINRTTEVRGPNSPLRPFAGDETARASHRSDPLRGRRGGERDEKQQHASAVAFCESVRKRQESRAGVELINQEGKDIRIARWGKEAA